MTSRLFNLLFFLLLTFSFSVIGLPEYSFSNDLSLISAETLFNPAVLITASKVVLTIFLTLSALFSLFYLISVAFIPVRGRYQSYLFILVTSCGFLTFAAYIRDAMPQLSLAKIFIAPVYDSLLLGATLIFWLSVTIALALLIKRARVFRASFLLALSVIFLSPFLNGSYSPLTSVNPGNNAKVIAEPQVRNLVIIGLDSVSLNHLNEYRGLLPNLSGLVETGHLFSNAYTPLARTFPAWISLLTGQYPATTGVRFNLTKTERSLLENNLAQDVKQQGFTTVFAQDERRFSNINESYGFDKAIGPELGVSDFLMPVISDHFVVAYMTDSVLGPWLFPGVYNNRVAPKTYNPKIFSGSVTHQLSVIDQPFFLAAHFCMPHFPYKWRGSEPSLDETELHKSALLKADAQIGEVIQALKDNDQWNDTILVLMSDHGEGLGHTHNTWTDPDAFNNSRVLRLLRGHGNSLFSKDQTHIILHISTPEDRHNGTYTENNRLASLIDIRPTVLNLLGLPQPDSPMDGIDLFSDHTPSERILFMETGVTAALPMPEQTSLASDAQLREWIDSYRISESGLLTISPEYAALQVLNKQTAAMSANHLLIRDHRSYKTEGFFISKKTGDFIKEEDMDESRLSEARSLIKALDCYESGSYPQCETGN